MRAGVMATGAAILGLAAAAGASPRVTVSGELGAELDSNALREAHAPGQRSPLAAPLVRGSGRAGLLWWPGRRLRLTAGVGGGVKAYLPAGRCPGDAARAADRRAGGQALATGRLACAGDADEQVVRADASARVVLGRGWALGLALAYYDDFQASSRPLRDDFRSGRATLSTSLRPARLPVAIEARVGYRGLQQKNVPRLGFHALRAGAGVLLDLRTGPPLLPIRWGLGADYDVGLRVYPDHACVLPAGCPAERADANHLVRLHLTYTGDALARLWYAAEVNRSEVPGEGYVRHVLGLSFTAHLLLGVDLTVRGRVFFNRSLAALAAAGTRSFDDEGLSSLLVQLARDVGPRWSVIARYGLYLHEAVPPALRGIVRHTLFLGLRFHHGTGGDAP